MSEDDFLQFKVAAEDDGRRVDAVVAERAGGLSRSLAQTLVREGSARVNGKTVRPAHRVQSGDIVDVSLLFPPSFSAEPQSIPLRVAYQDGDLAIIDKPAGLVVHPAAGHRSGTLANALAARFPDTQKVGSRDRPGIVHRLDKDTSGLIAVALNPRAHEFLQREIASRRAERLYLALVSGRPEADQATIDAPIGRDTRDRKRMAVHGAAARPASTSFRVVEELPGFTLVEAKLHTGRTHQIRVHLAAIGHPVAGDDVYRGQQLPGLSRQFLHAHRLSLRSPSRGDTIVAESPLPRDLHRVLESLRATRR
jgi:23S rRNA pseudouridine1911/1915/1917 synthase